MVFIKTRLILPSHPEETCSISYNTDIVVTGAGLETRIPKRVEPLFNFSFDSLVVTRNELDYLIDFYKQVGQTNTFTFKSQVENQTNGIERILSNELSPTTVKTYGKLVYNASIQKYQAVKTWEVLNSNSNRKAYKTLRHIDEDSIVLYNGVNPISSFNYEGFGIFTGNLANLKLECTYLHEVRFNSELSYESLGNNIFRITGLTLVEEVNNSIGGFLKEDFNNTPLEMELNSLPSYTNSLSYPTQINTLENERNSNYTSSPLLANKKEINTTSIDEVYKDALITWFVISRGRCLDFIYDSSLSRFDSDTLSITALSTAGTFKVFELGSLSLKSYSSEVKPSKGNLTIVGYRYGNGSENNQSGLLYTSLSDYISETHLKENPDSIVNIVPAVVSSEGRWLKMFAERGNLPSSTNVLVIAFVSFSSEYYTSTNNQYFPTEAYLEDYELFINSIQPTDKFVLIQNSIKSSNVNSIEFIMHDKLSKHFIQTAIGGSGYKANPFIGQITFVGNPGYLMSNYSDISKGIAFYYNTLHEIKTLAFCMKVTRGTESLGFTSLDQDLLIDGVLYHSKSAIEPSATSSEINLSTDNLEIKTLISNQLITSGQLATGYWDGSLVQISLVDFVTPPTTFEEAIPIIKGRIGRTTLSNNYNVFELRSITELLNRPLVKKTSPICSYQFGDVKCGIDLINAGYKISVAITEVISNNALRVNISSLSPFFNSGIIEVLSGANKGLILEINGVLSNNSFFFNGELIDAFEVSDSLLLTAFCQKHQYACKAYNNFSRFGGIPIGGNFIPGLDKITVVL